MRTIAWVSRHQPNSAEFTKLKRHYGAISIVEFSERVENIRHLLDFYTRLPRPKDMVVIGPAWLYSELIREGIKPLHPRLFQGKTIFYRVLEAQLELENLAPYCTAEHLLWLSHRVPEPKELNELKDFLSSVVPTQFHHDINVEQEVEVIARQIMDRDIHFVMANIYLWKLVDLMKAFPSGYKVTFINQQVRYAKDHERPDIVLGDSTFGKIVTGYKQVKSAIWKPQQIT